MPQASQNQTSPVSSQRPPFAVRYPFLIHGMLVVLCWLTYLFDRENVVWRFIKDSASPRPLEHFAFAVAAACIASGVWLGAWPGGSRANRANQTARSIRRRSLGEILHIIGIASLLPLVGSIALICVEAIRSIHFARCRIATSNGQAPANERSSPHNLPLRRTLFRHVAGICAFLSMLVFSITLRDRLADALFAATGLVFIVACFINAG